MDRRHRARAHDTVPRRVPLRAIVCPPRTGAERDRWAGRLSGGRTATLLLTADNASAAGAGRQWKDRDYMVRQLDDDPTPERPTTEGATAVRERPADEAFMPEGLVNVWIILGLLMAGLATIGFYLVGLVFWIAAVAWAIAWVASTLRD